MSSPHRDPDLGGPEDTPKVQFSRTTQTEHDGRVWCAVVGEYCVVWSVCTVWFGVVGVYCVVWCGRCVLCFVLSDVTSIPVNYLRPHLQMPTGHLVHFCFPKSGDNDTLF